MHRVAHPKPLNRDKRPRFRSKHKRATVFDGWEESSGKSRLSLSRARFREATMSERREHSYLTTLMQRFAGGYDAEVAKLRAERTRED